MLRTSLKADDMVYTIDFHFIFFKMSSCHGWTQQFSLSNFSAGKTLEISFSSNFVITAY